MMKPKDKRTIHYSFKASEAESDRIQEKMKAAGISNQSAYIRAMALNGYGSLSNNVNQIARRMNEHGGIYETEVDDITDKQNQILGVLNQILARLNLNSG